jgi:hypothetical protein
MSLFHIFIIIVVVGVLLWAVNQYVPMQAQVKKILNIVVVLFIVCWLLSLLLPMVGFHDVYVGKR